MASPNQDAYGNYQPGSNGAIQSGATNYGTSGPASNSAGNGAPTGSAQEGSFYTQKDSVPPGLVWSYYGGAWHS